jgi:hypothetical protein
MTTPPPSPRSHRWRIAAVVALVVLLSGELAVRAAEPYFDAPEVWADQATAVKIAQLDDIDCADVVFVGSSMARDAFVPEVFSDADPAHRASYNAALDAASPQLLEHWVLDQVAPRANPGAVVIGVASFELNRGSTITVAAEEAYQRSAYSGTGFANRLEGWFTRQLALVRNRATLRDPSALASAWQRWRDGARADRPSSAGIPGVLAEDGHGLSRRERHYSPSADAQAFVEEQLLGDYAISTEQTDALERLIRSLRRDGVEVALVELPVTDDYLALHPRGADDDRDFQRAIRDLADRTGAVVVPRVDVPDEAFADTHHLNGEGADQLSAALPGLLADAGLPVSGC